MEGGPQPAAVTSTPTVFAVGDVVCAHAKHADGLAWWQLS